MTDITFNPITRDLEFAPDGDFLINENCSTQNGTILLVGHAMNILQPAYGVGFDNQIIGNNTSYAANQLNRWAGQVQADGGKGAWNRKIAPGTDFSFDAEVNY